MLRVNDDVTAWVLKNKFPLTIVIVGLVLASIVIFNSDNSSVRIGNEKYRLIVVQDERSRAQGLSGRSSLANDQAMLFKFDSEKEQCFWMKDMKFAIDIVWLNSRGEVVAVEKNVLPESYPANYCHKGQSVIEFTSGQVEASRLQVGDRLKL